jgi:class 3 adenylate cyclase
MAAGLSSTDRDKNEGEMDLDAESLTLTEIIQLQTRLSQILQRRFERKLALAFTDVAGSTEYFARYGDEAGRALVQRHLDLLNKVLSGGQGRIVDTAGDGAFTCFATAELARQAMVELQRAISLENLHFSREHQLVVRCGMHYGPVLTDGVLVSGDAVNLCARVMSTAKGGEIRLTRAVFQELSSADRLYCRDMTSVDMKGIGRSIDVFVLKWRDPSQFPSSVHVVETGKEFQLPDQDIITFGRLREVQGAPANDIVLDPGDEQRTLQISRWHFELRRRPEGFLLRPLSEQITEVDGVIVPKGEEVPLRTGTKVRLARFLTLEFKSSNPYDGELSMPTEYKKPLTLP